ncbi:TonB-dependent receptor SusC [termite gut metagenome]|uniref:TonB-dependent receptor SusC n=1 Tax=termite gut metagenome TaxID=433724 RepID=A0A5J4RFR4_9ZZZZ
MQQFNWLNELKLRGSWGIVGNVLALGSYSTATNLIPRNAVFNQKIMMGYTAAKAVNTNLKWESTTKKNIGLDVTVLNSTLYFVSDFYLEDTHDLLFEQPIPTSTGLGNSSAEGYTGVSSNPYDNIGHVRNTGFNLELGYRKRIGNWSYDVSVNLSHVSNKVIDLKGLSLLDTDNNTMTQGGYPVGSYYGYLTKGLFRTQADLDNNSKYLGSAIGDIWYLDVNGKDDNGNLTGKPDGKIDADDRVVFGKVRPDFSYGISGQAGYKNFTLQLQLQGIQGIDKYMRSGQWATDMFGGEANMEADYILDRYHPEKNPNGKYPKISRASSGHNDVFSDFWMIDGSYLSIRNVNLNYKVPENISGKKLWVKDLNVYCSVQNLYTFGNAYAEISNTVNIPIPRTWTFGLKFSL